MYVLRRTSDGAYVAQPGSASSYTRKLEHAQTFSTRDDAVKASCPENERPVDVWALMTRTR
jgi:hypothetical protein